MCKHTNVTFLGYQEHPNGSLLPLFNCDECHTTITVKNSNKNVEYLPSSLQKKSFNKHTLSYG